jgi:hypothetical protein
MRQQESRGPSWYPNQAPLRYRSGVLPVSCLDGEHGLRLSERAGCTGRGNTRCLWRLGTCMAGRVVCMWNMMTGGAHWRDLDVDGRILNKQNVGEMD